MFLPLPPIPGCKISNFHGATVASLVAQNYRVGIVDVTEGEPRTRGTRAIRKAEATAASKILGIPFRHSLKLPMENIEVNQTNIKKINQIIRVAKPEILLFPHWLERHPDHEQHTHTLCREDTLLLSSGKVPNPVSMVHCRNRAQPKNIFILCRSHEFTPHFISMYLSVYEKKEKESLSVFKSQFYDSKSKERETMLSSKFIFGINLCAG